MPRSRCYVPWNDTERDAILSAIPPSKRTPQNIQFLQSVVKRIRPLACEDGAVGREVYFTSPDHHLDRDALLRAPTLRHPDARSMRVKSGRLYLHDRLLHTCLYNIFCADGQEWPSAVQNAVLAHVCQYPPTADEHQASGGEAVGQTCSCANPQHVVMSSKRANLIHQYRYEGRPRPFSESNFNTSTQNEEVDAFRNECWSRATGGTSPPLHDRLTWKPDDPRFRVLKAWAKRRSSSHYMESWQNMMGIRSRRTMLNYLLNRTHVVRHHSNARRHFPRAKVVREEKRVVARILDKHVPDAMKAAEHVPFLERVVGAPATNKDTRSPTMFAVLIRALRRRLNERFGHPANTRFGWITQGNVTDVLNVIPDIERRLIGEVVTWAQGARSSC